MTIDQKALADDVRRALGHIVSKPPVMKEAGPASVVLEVPGPTAWQATFQRDQNGQIVGALIVPVTAEPKPAGGS
jgi:hypothetical protein